jgi:hypothetical protein
MKKILMMLNCGRAAFTAVLCCAMTMAVLTACSDNDDDPVIPSENVNKGIVINLGSIVIKPYMLFGASLADVEAYMQKNYGDWAYTKEDQQEGQIFYTRYRNGNKVISYAFNNTPAGSLRLATYGFENTEISFPEIKAELERNGFIYQGKLNFEFPTAADEYQLFLSADRCIEVQFARWENDNRWAIGFQPLDEDDLNYLEPVNK